MKHPVMIAMRGFTAGIEVEYMYIRGLQWFPVIALVMSVVYIFIHILKIRYND